MFYKLFNIVQFEKRIEYFSRNSHAILVCMKYLINNLFSVHFHFTAIELCFDIACNFYQKNVN
jgi:hypothetical protein